jgi:hypothetical protein
MEQLLSIMRDPKAWGLFFAFVKVVLSSLGVNLAPEQWDVWEDVFNAICGAAVGLGIFHYHPKKEEQYLLKSKNRGSKRSV